MEIKCLPSGMFGSNSYIISNNGECAVIDAGVRSSEIMQAAEEKKIKYIILTHGHIDHICCVDDLRAKTSARVLICEADAQALTNPVKNGSSLFGAAKTFNPADEHLKDKDIIDIGGMKLHVIHTPGHSPGCICIKIGNHVFTGDTLFRLSIGRTDLEGGSYPQIIESINKKLAALEDDTIVYPGHGEASTIGYEKKYNPFLTGAL